jgi:ubiquinone/menaquinone biosynthesis C-methylase UbiE
MRCLMLYRRQGDRTCDLVTRSYDRIACGYDQAWTAHMRDLSLAMLDRLDLSNASPGLTASRNARAIDLTCGTGLLTAELARRIGGEVIGVDTSAGMLAEARRQHGHSCRFLQTDVVEFLLAQPCRSADVVVCGWGLGYTRPLAVVREIARVLRPGGRAAIIDNTLFSLAEVLWCSLLAFAERPEALAHVMKVRFLPGSLALAMMMRAYGLSVRWRHDGSKTYHVADGQAAIARLTATGAAAGFEFAAGASHKEAIFSRFAEIMDRRCRTDQGVPVTHRYLAAVGFKPSQ